MCTIRTVMIPEMITIHTIPGRRPDHNRKVRKFFLFFRSPGCPR